MGLHPRLLGRQSGEMTAASAMPRARIGASALTAPVASSSCFVPIDLERVSA